jgi:hypothetical protein
MIDQKKYTSDYSVTWYDASKNLPVSDNKNVVCFHCGCEFVGYVKDNLWFTKLGTFDAEVNVSYWKNIPD